MGPVFGLKAADEGLGAVPIGLGELVRQDAYADGGVGNIEKLILDWFGGGTHSPHPTRGPPNASELVRRGAIVGGVGRVIEVDQPEKCAVLIPVKPFGLAKSRLAPVWSPSERESIARAMLRNVIASARGMRVAIVAPSTAEDVRRVALINGARFLPEPDQAGLDGAVQSGVGQLANLGYTRVIVVHSDLPHAQDVAWLADTPGVIIVPDRTGRGTNAISVPANSGFRFSYGAGSLERHCDEARRLGFDPKVVVDPEGLSVDVDEPEDAKRAGFVSA